MKSASVLLALVVVLSFVSDAGAKPIANVNNDDYSIWWGMQRFGFHDGTSTKMDGSIVRWSFVNLGPLGSHEVPFNATQGLVGFCVIVTTLIALVTAFTVRWNRRINT
jgi:hypothetical protein